MYVFGEIIAHIQTIIFVLTTRWSESESVIVLRSLNDGCVCLLYNFAESHKMGIMDDKTITEKVLLTNNKSILLSRFYFAINIIQNHMSSQFLIIFRGEKRKRSFFACEIDPVNMYKRM